MDNWVQIYLQQNIQKAINSLGIERTLETIEHIANPIFRAKLRQIYFEMLKNRFYKSL